MQATQLDRLNLDESLVQGMIEVAEGLSDFQRESKAWYTSECRS